MSKLTEDQVRNIRDLYFNKVDDKGKRIYLNHSFKLAHKFNISQATIRSIIKMNTWKFIETEENKKKYIKLYEEEYEAYLKEQERLKKLVEEYRKKEEYENNLRRQKQEQEHLKQLEKDNKKKEYMKKYYERRKQDKIEQTN